jgi:hypothetical protein
MDAVSEVENLLAKIESGYLPPNEPLFVIRARDLSSDRMVLEWCAAARELGSPEAKIAEAKQVALAMETWPVKQVPGRPETQTGSPPTAGPEPVVFPAIDVEQAVLLIHAIARETVHGIDGNGQEITTIDAAHFWTAARMIEPKLLASFGGPAVVSPAGGYAAARHRLARFLLAWARAIMLSTSGKAG